MEEWTITSGNPFQGTRTGNAAVCSITSSLSNTKPRRGCWAANWMILCFVFSYPDSLVAAVRPHSNARGSLRRDGFVLFDRAFVCVTGRGFDLVRGLVLVKVERLHEFFLLPFKRQQLFLVLERLADLLLKFLNAFLAIRQLFLLFRKFLVEGMDRVFQ